MTILYYKHDDNTQNLIIRKTKMERQNQMLGRGVYQTTLQANSKVLKFIDQTITKVLFLYSHKSKPTLHALPSPFLGKLWSCWIGTFVVSNVFFPYSAIKVKCLETNKVLKVNENHLKPFYKAWNRIHHLCGVS